MSTQLNLDQKRSAHAWKAVDTIAKLGEKQRHHWATEAKKLPVRIMTAGLGQALAYVEAKDHGSKDGAGHLSTQLTDWCIRQRLLPGKDPQSLQKSVMLGDATFLHRATDEALAWLQWANRFAEAQGIKPSED